MSARTRDESKDRWCVARPPRYPKHLGFVVGGWFRWRLLAVLALPRFNRFSTEGEWRVMSLAELDETWTKVGWPY